MTDKSIVDALNQAHQTLPAWAYDLLAQAAQATQATPPPPDPAAQDSRDAAPVAKSWPTAAVPTSTPPRPRVAFVGLSPSALDGARGEALCGWDGRAFNDAYLAPLGLTKADVLMTHVAPVVDAGPAQLAEWHGWAQDELRQHGSGLIVVALGKAAREHLGARADFVLPHPACLREGRGSAEVERKVQKLADRLARVTTAPDVKVSIGKADNDKQVVYGVVLDPHTVDAQDDWCPPWEIESTAWDWVKNSRTVGIQHSGDADASMVESVLWPYPTPADYQAAMQNKPHQAITQSFGNTEISSGAWLLAVQVDSAPLWKQVKDGSMTGFSIGGTGIRTASTAQVAMPKVAFRRL